MRLHTHVALLHNSVLLGTEVFFLLLMAGGIYMRNSGLRAFKIMFREVRDYLFCHDYRVIRLKAKLLY